MNDSLNRVTDHVGLLSDQAFILIVLLAVITAVAWLGLLRLYAHYANLVKALPKKDRRRFLERLLPNPPDNPSDNQVKVFQLRMRLNALIVLCIGVTSVLVLTVAMNRKEIANSIVYNTSYSITIREASPKREEKRKRASAIPSSPAPPIAPAPLPDPLPARVARADLESACVAQISGLMLDSDRAHWCTCGIGAMLDAGVSTTLQHDMLSNFELGLNDAKNRYPDLEKRLARCAV